MCLDQWRNISSIKDSKLVKNVAKWHKSSICLDLKFPFWFSMGFVRVRTSQRWKWGKIAFQCFLLRLGQIRCSERENCTRLLFSSDQHEKNGRLHQNITRLFQGTKLDYNQLKWKSSQKWAGHFIEKFLYTDRCLLSQNVFYRVFPQVRSKVFLKPK